MHHTILALLSLKLHFEDLLFDSVFALVSDAGDGAAGAGWEEDEMVVEEGVFEDVAEAVAAGDVVADLEVGGGVEGPFLFAVE